MCFRLRSRVVAWALGVVASPSRKEVVGGLVVASSAPPKPTRSVAIAHDKESSGWSGITLSEPDDSSSRSVAIGSHARLMTGCREPFQCARPCAYARYRSCAMHNRSTCHTPPALYIHTVRIILQYT